MKYPNLLIQFTYHTDICRNSILRGLIGFSDLVLIRINYPPRRFPLSVTVRYVWQKPRQSVRMIHKAKWCHGDLACDVISSVVVFNPVPIKDSKLNKFVCKLKYQLELQLLKLQVASYQRLCTAQDVASVSLRARSQAYLGKGTKKTLISQFLMT